MRMCRRVTAHHKLPQDTYSLDMSDSGENGKLSYASYLKPGPTNITIFLVDHVLQVLAILLKQVRQTNATDASTNRHHPDLLATLVDSNIGNLVTSPCVTNPVPKLASRLVVADVFVGIHVLARIEYHGGLFESQTRSKGIQDVSIQVIGVRLWYCLF